MPTIVAILLAAVVAGVVEDWLRPFLGIRLTALAALSTWGLTFYFTRRWLLDLRDGG